MVVVVLKFLRRAQWLDWLDAARCDVVHCVQWDGGIRIWANSLDRNCDVQFVAVRLAKISWHQKESDCVSVSKTSEVVLPTRAEASSFYYGWINVVVASIAMTATLPGRTHGLGLITEPLLKDLAIQPVAFAKLNFISAIVGASFCIPIGWLIDRMGVRSLLALVTFALGVSVVAMSSVVGPMGLLISLVCVRGFGQSALSLLSIAVIAKWFRRRLGIAMGVFAVLLTFGFIGSVLVMGSLIEQRGWSIAWSKLGWCLIGLSPMFWLLTRDAPIEFERGEAGLRSHSQDATNGNDQAEETHEHQWNLFAACFSPAFWILVLGSSAFNFVWSGVTLFNESIVKQRGMDQAASVEIMAILTGVGLLANLICGGITTRARVLKLLSVGLVFLAFGLALFPLVAGTMGARLYALAIGVSGGMITIVFFASWRHLFGERELGTIQGAAQLATVLASALGPIVMAESFQRLGSYSPFFFVSSAMVGSLAIAAWWILPPDRRL